MERAAKAKEELQHIDYGAGSKHLEEAAGRSGDAVEHLVMENIVAHGSQGKSSALEADGLSKGEQGDSPGKLAPEGVVDDVTKKMAGGKGNPATNGSRRQTSSSSKSSCDDDGAAGKLKVVAYSFALNYGFLFSYSSPRSCQEAVSSRCAWLSE